MALREITSGGGIFTSAGETEHFNIQMMAGH